MLRMEPSRQSTNLSLDYSRSGRHQMLAHQRDGKRDPHAVPRQHKLDSSRRLRKREFLAHRNRGRSGDEIKEFIYQGGDPRQFVTCAVGNIDRDGAQMTTWVHVLAAGWAGREMLATVQLFAGSELGMSFVAGSEEGKSFGEI